VSALETFTLLLVTPAGQVYHAPVWQVTARNTVGFFSIRAHHCNFESSVEPGKVELALTPELRRDFMVQRGALRMNANECVVICESAEEIRPDAADTKVGA
jgi:F0F1-type ATP synthase epsilon subunit